MPKGHPTPKDPTVRNPLRKAGLDTKTKRRAAFDRTLAMSEKRRLAASK